MHEQLSTASRDHYAKKMEVRDSANYHAERLIGQGIEPDAICLMDVIDAALEDGNVQGFSCDEIIESLRSVVAQQPSSCVIKQALLQVAERLIQQAQDKDDAFITACLSRGLHPMAER